MKLTIELQRVGKSRVSYESIPIVARVVQGRFVGVNLIPEGLTDLECAKRKVESDLRMSLGVPFEIVWIDRTAERDD